MTMKKLILAPVLMLAALSTQVYAGPEAGHPNIIAAREDAQHAIEKMHAAQVANEYDMNGHAAKAKQLLKDAEKEMKLAAEAANKNKK